MRPVLMSHLDIHKMNHIEEYIECWAKQRNRREAKIRRKKAKALRRNRYKEAK